MFMLKLILSRPILTSIQSCIQKVPSSIIQEKDMISKRNCEMLFSCSEDVLYSHRMSSLASRKVLSTISLEKDMTSKRSCEILFSYSLFP